MYTPKDHEELFDVKPVGVKYICEFCNEGEMIADKTMIANPFEFLKSPLIAHKCTKCGKTLQLMENYPKIEWVKSEHNIDNRED